MVLPPLDDRFNPRFFLRVGGLLDRLARVYWRYQWRGLDRLPAGPAVLVGNHSALGTAELICMVGRWSKHFGTKRRATGLMHDVFMKTPGFSHYYRAVGAVPANRDNARAAIARGHDILVFPGGDLDSARPFYQPRRVFFGKRRGYVRIALESGVPIVPIATIGSHYTWLMAPGGRAVARLLRLDRLLRNDRVPLSFGIGLALLAGVLFGAGWLPLWATLLLVVVGLAPTPARITSEALPPIDVCAETAHLDSMEARIEEGHALVLGALEGAVAHMQHGKPWIRS